MKIENVLEAGAFRREAICRRRVELPEERGGRARGRGGGLLAASARERERIEANKEEPIAERNFVPPPFSLRRSPVIFFACFSRSLTLTLHFECELGQPDRF